MLKDADFGELLVDGAQPRRWDYVFASVQSLSASRLQNLNSKHFDVVVIDEFHHAQAPTYKALLDHLQPQELLGLTATPERGDGTEARGSLAMGCFEGRKVGDRSSNDQQQVWEEALATHDDLQLIVSGPVTNLAAFEATHSEAAARFGATQQLAWCFRGN